VAKAANLCDPLQARRTLLIAAQEIVRPCQKLIPIWSIRRESADVSVARASSSRFRVVHLLTRNETPQAHEGVG